MASLLLMMLPSRPGSSTMMSSPELKRTTSSLPTSAPPKPPYLYSMMPSGERLRPKSKAKPRQLRSGSVPTGYSLTCAGSAPLVGLPPLRTNSLRVGLGWP